MSDEGRDDGLLGALKEANQRLLEERQIFISGPVVVFKWRNAAGWPVEYVSRNADQVFGHSADDFLAGRVLYADLIHPGDLQRVADEVARASESAAERFAHVPYRITRGDGREVWLDDFTTIVRGPDGTVSHYLGYVIDVTERQRFEADREQLLAQILEAQKLESLGILAGGIAHDFNNLLTAMLGNVGLVQRALPDAHAGRRPLQDIRAAAGRAADLCSQMLAYSGRGRFVVGDHDLNQIIREMAELLEVSVARTATFELDLEAGLPAVEVDATQVRQVILNLITNASEAIGDRPGRIVLRTRLATLETSPQGSLADPPLPAGRYVVAEVADDGEGMDDAVRARMFDPFFSTKFTGRGLGLAATLGIVRGHHGAITVDSRPGGGTRVQVLLPPSGRPAMPLPEPADDLGDWRGAGTLLVVDDEEVVRHFATQVLEEAGLAVRCAADGIEGLSMFDREPRRIDAAIVDLTMPRMGGLETCRQLRRRQPDLPIVLTSGYDEVEVSRRCQGMEPSAFLQKPFHDRQLLACVRAALEGPPPAHPPR